jgi:predicted PhzF superfamily epimerase YddE/YHI9
VTTAFAQVDAFTTTPFGGNPAAVCLLPGPAAPGWMAAVARETNLPATVFVHASPDGFGVRWFTATTELQLCGHGTLAAAHVLYETGRLEPGDVAHFQSPNGRLSAHRADGWIMLDFPAIPEERIDPPPGLLDALGVEATYVGRGRLDCLVEVADESIVRGVQPDLDRLRRVPTRGVIVTSRSATADRDFVSRFFAPSTGINEDFVTGSAHCCLAPFWARRLGRTSMVAHQLSSRGGVLKLTVEGDRVRIAGQAVTVVRGELTIAPPD